MKSTCPPKKINFCFIINFKITKKIREEVSSPLAHARSVITILQKKIAPR
jgi:hypothetical protein